ncbi:hypothetical protein L2E82_39362 [Cichorium intybus]|uniref:Uncharacterized protein n=1 Tax=Cichorium intybus TaxID=13427 RepID=A0ACB9AI04_CICIN|nr:hypothetical protein L2E82_39362 [Cichorium intybus]
MAEEYTNRRTPKSRQAFTSHSDHIETELPIRAEGGVVVSGTSSSSSSSPSVQNHQISIVLVEVEEEAEDNED